MDALLDSNPVALRAGGADAATLESRVNEQRLWQRLFVLSHVALLLLPLATAWWVPKLANIRNLQFGVLLLTGLWAWRRNLLGSLSVSPGLIRLLMGAALVSACVHAAYLYASFNLNGTDFSYFDWMLASTTRGRFMYAPLCDCNHFVRHPSYWLLALQPVHALFDSPWLLIMVEPLAWLAGAWLVYRLALAMQLDSVVAVLVLVAYLTHDWSGALLNYGFHFEVFYLPAGLLLALGWVQRRPFLAGAGAAAFLATKEDGALYLLAFASAAFAFDKDRRRHAACIGLASLALLSFNVGYIQRGSAPSYLGFWSHYGEDLPSILRGMLAQPGAVTMSVLRSRWWYLFASFAFAPFITPTLLAAMAPGLLVLGTAGSTQMTQFRLYYAAPLLPFMWWSLCAALSRYPKLRWALFVVPVLGGQYQRFYQPRLDALADASDARTMNLTGSVCAQTSLHPHFAYHWDLRALDSQCLSTPGAVAFVHPQLPPYPHTSRELEALVERSRTLQTWPSGLVLMAPAGAAIKESSNGITNNDAASAAQASPPAGPRTL